MTDEMPIGAGFIGPGWLVVERQPSSERRVWVVASFWKQAEAESYIARADNPSLFAVPGIVQKDDDPTDEPLGEE